MIQKIEFPIWKIRAYTDIEEKLGRVLITTIYDTYILDDTTLKGDYVTRRLYLKHHSKYPLYPLKDKLEYLRHMIKYNTGTVFIDNTGYIFKYKKSSKRFLVTCEKIKALTKIGPETVFYVGKEFLPYTTTLNLDYIPYASIMHTNNGPLLYDFTTERHNPYRRKI